MSDSLKIVKTDDGSFTLHSKKYDETYHSVSGAIEESFNKFSRPCRIGALALTGAVSILDIGFGLGYNLLAAIYAARKANKKCKINIVSLENDLLDVSVLDSLPVLEQVASFYEIIKSAAKKLSYDRGNIDIRIIEGDARETIKTVQGKFDAVFLDPFSVKKNVELWTVDFFKEVYKRMTETAILATYSASTPVRCGLMEAGFIIGPGPGDLMKKGGTLATKCAIIECFSEKEKQKFKTSPERKPFYDPCG